MSFSVRWPILKTVLLSANPEWKSKEAAKLWQSQTSLHDALKRLLNESKKIVIQTLYQIDFRDYKAYPMDLSTRSTQ